MTDHDAENSNLALEMARARAIAGPRPVWIWPSWLIQERAFA